MIARPLTTVLVDRSTDFADNLLKHALLLASEAAVDCVLQARICILGNRIQTFLDDGLERAVSTEYSSREDAEADRFDVVLTSSRHCVLVGFLQYSQVGVKVGPPAEA